MGAGEVEEVEVCGEIGETGEWAESEPATAEEEEETMEEEGEEDEVDDEADTEPWDARGRSEREEETWRISGDDEDEGGTDEESVSQPTACSSSLVPSLSAWSLSPAGASTSTLPVELSPAGLVLLVTGLRCATP